MKVHTADCDIGLYANGWPTLSINHWSNTYCMLHGDGASDHEYNGDFVTKHLEPNIGCFFWHLRWRFAPSIVPGLKCNNCCAEKLILISVVHQKLKIMLRLAIGFSSCQVQRKELSVSSTKCWELKTIVLWVSSRASCKLPTRSSKWTQMVSACRVGMP